MNKIPIFQVDAFTDKLFSGNPAAVCLLKSWISDEKMQLIATENNLAETAFIVAKNNDFEIRWFTPKVEVDLCGHATLAAAYVLFYCQAYKQEEIIFHSPRSGELRVSLQDKILLLNFPTDTVNPCDEFLQIKKCIPVQAIEIYKGKTDYIAIVSTEQEVRELHPDLNEISKLKARGLIVTAKGDDVDFVSRFFAPQSGIDEDPVTGSAHTSLIPIWSEKLNKKEMVACQLSERGGRLYCINQGERSLIGGEAKLYMTGEINIE